MARSLEESLEPFEYNVSDIFVPFKAAIRHLPEILAQKDPVIKYYELILNGFITGMQAILTGYVLYKNFIYLTSP